MLVKFEIFLPLLPLRFERMIPDPGPCSDWKLTRDVIVFIGGIGIPDECPVFDSGGSVSPYRSNCQCITRSTLTTADRPSQTST